MNKDEYTRWISDEEFKKIEILGEKPRTVWVAIIEVEISKLIGQRKIAIVMNAPAFKDAEDIDYLITNVEGEIATEQWIVDTYSQRNWIEEKTSSQSLTKSWFLSLPTKIVPLLYKGGSGHSFALSRM